MSNQHPFNEEDLFNQTLEENIDEMEEDGEQERRLNNWLELDEMERAENFGIEDIF